MAAALGLASEGFEAVLVERKSITESAFGKLMNLFRQKLGHA